MNTSSEITFKNSNPGAVRFGNFINYYKFYSAHDRIKLFPRNIWQKSQDNNIYLDIGCNTGDLTVLLYQFLEDIFGNSLQCNFLGIDIDPALIIRAKENNKYKDYIKFECLDFMDDTQTIKILNYLQNYNRSSFNVCFCLSITMWIHLNFGDDGLKLFLNKVCDLSDMVVIEPQPWKCYKSAKKRLKQANSDFPLFKNILNRQNVENFIEQTFEERNFVKVYETPKTIWDRKIQFYKKKSLVLSNNC